MQMRPTRIDVGEQWRKKAHKALLAPATHEALRSTEQKREKEAAFDLLDALSRSGALPFESAELHVVVAMTHCFDASIMDTVIVKNVNPIEKLEKSSLLVATTVHEAPAERLIRADQQERVFTYSAPALMPPAEAPDEEAATPA